MGLCLAIAKQNVCYVLKSNSKDFSEQVQKKAPPKQLGPTWSGSLSNQ